MRCGVARCGVSLRSAAQTPPHPLPLPAPPLPADRAGPGRAGLRAPRAPDERAWWASTRASRPPTSASRRRWCTSSSTRRSRRGWRRGARRRRRRPAATASRSTRRPATSSSSCWPAPSPRRSPPASPTRTRWLALDYVKKGISTDLSGRHYLQSFRKRVTEDCTEDLLHSLYGRFLIQP